jgi:small neutral amino acid transporter SnatA (MarC family)
MMKFSGPFGFEFDEYGKELDTTKVAGGIILVSASVDALTSIDSSPQINDSFTSRCPGLKGRSSLVRFPSGALLEVVAP